MKWRQFNRFLSKKEKKKKKKGILAFQGGIGNRVLIDSFGRQKGITENRFTPLFHDFPHAERRGVR